MLKAIKTFDDFIFLNESFKDIRFVEKDHKYKINGELSKSSVTTLLKKYTVEFDSEKIAKNVSFKNGKNVKEILKEWDFKRNYSCFKGTEFHKYVENFLNRKFVSLDDIGFKNLLISEGIDNFDEQKNAYKEIMKNMVLNFLNFYTWYSENYYFLKSEFVVGDIESKICGTIDNLSMNKQTKNLSILDYKTNQTIKKKGFKGQKMLMEMSHLDDCEFTKYSLQLHMYKHIIEKNTSFKVDDLRIVWFPEKDKYEIINPLHLEKEAEFILQKEVLFL
jgi:hypothetical protein